MYARIARFEGGDTSQMDAVIDGAREMIDSNFDSPPEGLEGTRRSTRCRRLWTLARAGRASRSMR